jgi:histidine phosphotransfer protein HptB
MNENRALCMLNRMMINPGEICMNDADLDTFPLLDAEIIAELRDVMEKEFTVLINTFLNDLPIQLDRLHRAIDQGSAAEVYQAAHKLKSSCGSLGAFRLAELIRQLEQAGRLKTLDGAAELLQRIQVIAGETCVSLRGLPD